LLALRRGNHLITANCGDCRAVLGISNNTNGSKKDHFRALRLTNDHNAREAREQEKLKLEHPNEADIVKCHNSHACYVKGRLQLTRALGDVYLKYKEFNAAPLSHRSRYRISSLP
jgi:pyruvate dehydrogenase phosphatase